MVCGHFTYYILFREGVDMKGVIFISLFLLLGNTLAEFWFRRGWEMTLMISWNQFIGILMYWIIMVKGDT